MITFALVAIAKATLVCGVALLLSRVFRRRRASFRHLLFVLVFAALAVMPVAGVVLPSLSVPVTVPARAITETSRLSEITQVVLSSSNAEASKMDRAKALFHPEPASDSPSKSEALSHRRQSVTLAELMIAAWLLGAALFVLPVIAGLWQVRRLRQTASPWMNGREPLRTLASALGIRRGVDVLIHEAVTSPMTCGVLKPAILLPASAGQWDETALRCALTHELEHVARWDFLIHCVSRAICAAYWFHPLVWEAWRRLRLEAERACDDAVLQDVDPAAYASLLVSIARKASPGARQPLLAMAGRNDLAVRVNAVLKDDHARGRAGRRLTTVVMFTGIVLSLGIATISVVRAAPQTQTTTAVRTPLRFETVSFQRNDTAERSLMYWTEDADGRPGSQSGRVQWFRATNTNARMLIWSAYSVELMGSGGMAGVQQIDNAPSWVESERYDMLAKAPSPATADQMREMMRSFVTERFKLTAHRGSKEFPAYAILLARTDGRPGPRMTSSQLNCTPAPGVASPCGLAGAAGRLTGRGVTMAQLVTHLPKQVGGSRIVINGRLIDRTELTGAFDFSLEWEPDPVARHVLAANEITGQPEYRPFVFPRVTNAPNFIAALQDQLGLRIDEVQLPEPVLVIDNIERPE